MDLQKKKNLDAPKAADHTEPYEIMVSRNSIDRLREAIDNAKGIHIASHSKKNGTEIHTNPDGTTSILPKTTNAPTTGGASSPLKVHPMFHPSHGQCTGPVDSGTQGTRHKYAHAVTAQDVARQCELDHKCTGFQLDEGVKNDNITSAWIYHGGEVSGDDKSAATCFSREMSPKGYFAMSGRCQLDGEATGKRVSGVSVAKASQICDADPKCVGFDTDTQDPDKNVFFVTKGTAQSLTAAMKNKSDPSAKKSNRSCMIRSDPHIPEGFKRQQGRCAVKTGHGPSKCEPNIFEAAASGTTLDAKDFTDAIEKCRMSDDCTAVEVNKAHNTFTEYTIHNKDDVQGDTCENAFCFVRDHSQHTKKSIPTGTPNPHKRCDSQPFVPDSSSTPYKVLKTTDPNTCQRACLSEGPNCNAWKVDKKTKESGAPCALYKTWNGVQRVVAPDAGSLCFMGEDSDLKGFKDVSTSFTVWDNSTVLETGDDGVASYASNEHQCADRCSVTRGCKAFGFHQGTTPNAKDCDAPSSDCGICYLFNVPFESGHLLFRHTNFADPSQAMFTANRA